MTSNRNNNNMNLRSKKEEEEKNEEETGMKKFCKTLITNFTNKPMKKIYRAIILVCVIYIANEKAINCNLIEKIYNETMTEIM